MKYCSSCGAAIEADQMFCTSCGTAVSTPAASTQSAQATPEQPNNQTYAQPAPAAATQPMKWYKFLIYFMLWFNGVVYILSGLSSIITVISISAQGFHISPGGIITGLLLIGLGVFTIITRMHLAKFRTTGPLFLYLVYIISAVLTLLDTLILPKAMVSIIPQAAGSIIGTAIAVILNRIYFNKRAHMFKN